MRQTGLCHREYGEFLEHDIDENGKCKDCDYCYAAVVDGEFYDTLEGAMEAVIAILDNFTVPEEEMPSEAAIALGLAEIPRPEAQKRTVKLLKDAKLAFEIPEGVIFDGNGYEVNSADHRPEGLKTRYFRKCESQVIYPIFAISKLLII